MSQDFSPQHSDFIDDGYTEEGYIAAEDSGIHGPLEVSYRPILTAARDGVTKFLTRTPPDYDAYAEAAQKTVARNLSAWSLKDKSGNKVTISEANVRRLRPALFDKLWSLMGGMRASDKRPDQVDSPTLVDQEAAAKN